MCDKNVFLIILQLDAITIFKMIEMEATFMNAKLFIHVYGLYLDINQIS